MKRSLFSRILITFLVIVGIVSILKWTTHHFMSGDDQEVAVTNKHTILQMDLAGVIMNGKKFLKNLKDYKDEPNIKAILININSPGGVVGPSQEIYAEIKRFKEETKKPVVCVSTGLMASGAYYSAAACDKIVVAPGAMVGSIGVIMEFANLEKLYDWAKISRYTITSGRYKDSGAEYRSMRDDEKQLFQDMITEVYQQFRKVVMESRKLSDEVMDKYADGRVFTGAKAVELGFADQVGTFEDAVQLTAQMANLGKDFEVYEIPKKKKSIFDFGDAGEEDSLNSILQGSKPSAKTWVKDLVKVAMPVEMLNQPLFMMPGYWEK